jgi:hypothetical protein
VIKKWLFWIYILSFVFILGSAIYFWSLVFPNVILPTAQFFWAIYRIFASVNQRVYWVILVGIIVLLAYRVIFSIPKDIQDKYVTELDKPVRREQFWLETISNAIKNGEGSRIFLRRQLGQLFLSASNLNALSKTEDIEIALLNLQPPLPTNLLLLFKKGGDGHEKRLHTVDFTFARHIFDGMWWRRKRMAEVTYKNIDAILQSMEEYLEIDHEN